MVSCKIPALHFLCILSSAVRYASWRILQSCSFLHHLLLEIRRLSFHNNDWCYVQLKKTRYSEKQVSATTKKTSRLIKRGWCNQNYITQLSSTSMQFCYTKWLWSACKLWHYIHLYCIEWLSHRNDYAAVRWQYSASTVTVLTYSQHCCSHVSLIW